MTEQDLWLAHARAINERARRHIVLARQAQEDYSLVMAYVRDATLTPLEAAHAANALDEVRSRYSNLSTP